MDNAQPLVISDEDIRSIREQIQEQKRLAEFEELKGELFDISYKANHSLTDFDGGMKQVDTDKVLKTKRSAHTFSEMIIARFMKMCSFRPIVGSIVAVGLALACVICIFSFLHHPKLDNYRILVAYCIEMAAGVQILKSASRSLLLPVLATIIGAIVANTMEPNQLFLFHHQLFYQIMMLTGILGISISVFTID